MTPEQTASLLRLAKREVRVASSSRCKEHLLCTMKVPGGRITITCEGPNCYSMTQCAYFDDKKRDELRALGIPFTMEDCYVGPKLLLKGTLDEVAAALVPLYTIGE